MPDIKEPEIESNKRNYITKKMEKVKLLNLDELDSSESNFKNIIFSDKLFIAPYTNLGISEHELNPSDRLMFFNFCYVCARNVSLLNVNENLTSNIFNSIPSVYLGGINLDAQSFIIEIEIRAEEFYLLIPENGILSEYMWSVDTIAYCKTNILATKDIDCFFKNTVDVFYKEYQECINSI